MWRKLQSVLFVLFAGFSVALLWRYCTSGNFHAFADAFTYLALAGFILYDKQKAGLGRQTSREVISITIAAGLCFAAWSMWLYL